MMPEERAYCHETNAAVQPSNSNLVHFSSLPAWPKGLPKRAQKMRSMPSVCALVITCGLLSSTAVSAQESDACTDLLLSNGDDWHDAYGKEYTCNTYYSKPGKCQSNGANDPTEGMAAVVK